MVLMENLMAIFRKIVAQGTFFHQHHGKDLRNPIITIILRALLEDTEIAFKDCHNLRQHW
jgi:hypothetical protein